MKTIRGIMAMAIGLVALGLLTVASFFSIVALVVAGLAKWVAE